MPDPDSDDDALSWAGDDDATLAPGWKRVGAPSSATAPETANDGAVEASAAGKSAGSTGADAAGGTATADADSADADPAASKQLGSVELVALGVLGGVYLLYTVGWLLTAIRTSAPGQSVVGDAMYGFGLWMSVLAPALWFALVAALVKRPVLRLIWLAVGAVVLVPLPFVLGVTA
ncbi:DNA polymerase III subunit gamma/tau [Agromyces soli]